MLYDIELNDNLCQQGDLWWDLEVTRYHSALWRREGTRDRVQHSEQRLNQMLMFWILIKTLSTAVQVSFSGWQSSVSLWCRSGEDITVGDSTEKEWPVGFSQTALCVFSFSGFQFVSFTYNKHNYEDSCFPCDQ